MIDTALKHAIETALAGFTGRSLADAARALLGTYGIITVYRYEDYFSNPMASTRLKLPC